MLVGVLATYTYLFDTRAMGWRLLSRSKGRLCLHSGHSQLCNRCTPRLSTGPMSPAVHPLHAQDHGRARAVACPPRLMRRPVCVLLRALALCRALPGVLPVLLRQPGGWLQHVAVRGAALPGLVGGRRCIGLAGLAASAPCPVLLALQPHLQSRASPRVPPAHLCAGFSVRCLRPALWEKLPPTPLATLTTPCPAT